MNRQGLRGNAGRASPFGFRQPYTLEARCFSVCPPPSGRHHAARMNLFVTGGAGYIGSAFVEEALNAGHHVTVFDSLVEGHRAAVDPRATFVQGCLTDPTQIEASLKQAQAEAVIHFAAFALVGESMANPGKYFSNNVGAGLNLLKATISAGIRKFIFSSTCATFGIYIWRILHRQIGGFVSRETSQLL